MRAARIRAGFTLKEAAGLIGYTWVAVQRWEKDVCLPKPGVLLHLRSVYGAEEPWGAHMVPARPHHIPLRLYSRTAIQKPRRV
jgi:transcriptional regulator with XRE-family HTH domain